LHFFLNCKIGNLFLPQGALFNGQAGTIVDFSPQKDEYGDPVCVYFKPDVYLGEYYQPAIRIKQIPIVKSKIPIYDEASKSTFTRLNFPLDLGFSITSHRVNNKRDDIK